MRPILPCCTVYGLASTEAPTLIRYVGQTIRSTEKRLREHITHAQRTNYPVNRWIRKVLAAGHRVVLVVLEQNGTPGDAEIEWIARLKADGARLVNATSGGPGVLSPSEETRARLSAAKIGVPKSQAHRDKLRACQIANPSLGFQGHTHTTEAKRRFSRRGTTHTAETKALIAAAGVGRRYSPEARAKIWVVRRQRAAERALSGGAEI